MGMMEKVFLPSNELKKFDTKDYTNTQIYKNKTVFRMLILVCLTTLFSVLALKFVGKDVTNGVYIFLMYLIIIGINYNMLFVSQNKTIQQQRTLMYVTAALLAASSAWYHVVNNNIASIVFLFLNINILAMYQSKDLVVKVGMPFFGLIIGLILNGASTFDLALSYKQVYLTIYLFILFFIATYVLILSNRVVYKHIMYKASEDSMMSRKYEELLHSVASSLEQIASTHDNDSKYHIKRISKYSVELAKAIGLSTRDINEISIGAPLHDFGKISVSKEILNKPGALDDLEREEMQKHSVEGYLMVSNMKLGKKIENIILHHHERWDGSGYPHGLAGRSIPLEARIVAIADVYDALRSKRPYKDGWSHDRVRNHIVENAGKHFDPLLVNAFLEREYEFKMIFDNSADALGNVVNQ